MSALRPYLLLLPGLLVLAEGASADAIIVSQAQAASTIAEVFVEERAIRVELEIAVPDLGGFRNLLPDELLERLEVQPEPLAERLPRFFSEDMVFRVADGPPLPGRVTQMRGGTRIVRDEISGEPLPLEEGNGEVVVFATLEYPLATRPTSLSMTPPRGGSGFPAPAIGMVTYHQGVALNDFRYWGREEVLELDWADSWYSRFQTRSMKRQYDAPLNVFLYVEPYEVRVEIIARPKDLQQWTDMGLAGMDVIPVELQEEIKLKAAEFLSGRFELVIDGATVTPVLERVNFLERTLRTSTVVSPPRELGVLPATLGVILVAPTSGLPEEVSVTWNLFSDRITVVPAAATDEAGPFPYLLSADDRVLRWRNFLLQPTIPTMVEIIAPPPIYAGALVATTWISGLLVLGLALVSVRLFYASGQFNKPRLAAAGVLVCVGLASALLGRQHAITEARVNQIVGGLLHNVYRAFDFTEEGAIYDVLEQSVTGDLLAQIYLETRRGLELESQGGARAKVKSVDMLEVNTMTRDSGRSFVVRCVWNVSGSIGHWGHNHQRTNQYLAELTVIAVEGAWKLSGVEILQEDRLY